MEISNNCPKHCPRLYQYLATVTSSLNVLTSGMHYGWTSSALPILLEKNSPIPTTDNEGSWIAVMILIGAVCGSALAGVTLDRLGRKNVILLTAAMFFVSWVMLALAKSVPMIIAARFVAGIPDGLTYCTIPMYIGEIADYKVRGLLSSSFVVSATGGILFTNIIGSYLALETTAWISSIFPVILMVTFVWMPESPYCLIMKGNIEKAKKCLSIFRGTENVNEELTRIRESVELENTNTGKYLDLFTVRSNRKALYIILGVRAFTELSGTTALLFYAQIVFEQASSDISPVVASSIFFGVKMIASVVSSVLVDRTGRIPLAITSLIGCSIALFIEGTYFYIKTETSIDISKFSFISIVALIGFVVAINIGLQTVAIILIAEIFPTNVKAFAFSFNDICYCMFCLIASKFFQFTKDKFGMHVPFFVFACCCVLGLPFVIWCVPETKGKTLEEILVEMRRKKGPTFRDIAVMAEKISLAEGTILGAKGMTLDQLIQAEIDRRQRWAALYGIRVLSEEIPLVGCSYETKATLDQITQIEFDEEKETVSLHDVAFMSEEVPLASTDVSEQTQTEFETTKESPVLRDVGVMVEEMTGNGVCVVDKKILKQTQDDLEMKRWCPNLQDIAEMVEKISLKSNRSIIDTLEQIKDELIRKARPPARHSITETILTIKHF